MQHFSRQQLLARWDESSDVLHEAVFSDVNELTLDNLAEKFRLSDDQRADMAHLCLLVFLGFVSYRNVAQELQSELGLDAATALSLYQGIDAKIFEPIRKDIEDNYLKFKIGAVDEASVQKPSVVSQVNLKTPQPEGTVNLKKEDTGPKILSVGGLGAGDVPAPRPLVGQEFSPAPSLGGPSIIQKKQDVVSAARSTVVPPQTDRDIFSLSPKDRWGIENDDIIASRRIMGQPQAAQGGIAPAAPIAGGQILSRPSAVPPPGADAIKGNKEDELLPVVEEPRLPEVMPQAPRPTARQSQQLGEKKILAPLPVPPPPVPPLSRPQEIKNVQEERGPSPVINPTITVNIQAAPQNVGFGGGVASMPSVGSAPAGGGAPVQPVADSFVQRNQPAQPARPMQWAVPAQPARQPDVVVEIRQTQGSGATPDGGVVYQNKQIKDEPMPVRPMKMAQPVQSATPTHQITKEGGLTAAPMGAGRQPSVSSRPLDPSEAIDIGPVIIHKHDDPSVAHMQSGAQYKDLSLGGFSRNFSAQVPRQSAAPSVADVQIPVSTPANVGAANPRAAASLGQPANGYQPAATPPVPQKKGGFFSFFRK